MLSGLSCIIVKERKEERRGEQKEDGKKEEREKKLEGRPKIKREGEREIREGGRLKQRVLNLLAYNVTNWLWGRCHARCSKCCGECFVGDRAV